MVVFFAVAALPAYAVNAGDACTSEGSWIQKDTPDGETHLYCDGSTWKSYRAVDSIGRTSNSARLGSTYGVTVGMGTKCSGNSDKGTIRYNSGSDQWQYCNGAEWTTIPQKKGYNSAASGDVPSTGLVGYWMLDEKIRGTAVDSVSGNNGTLMFMNPTDWVTGKIGGALFFDGVDDYLAIPSSTAYDSTEGSWSFWFRTNGSWGTDGGDATDTAVVMDRADSTNSRSGLSILFGAAPNTDVRFSAKDSASTTVCSGTSSYYVNDSAWHHVVVTFSRLSGSTVTMYLDGLQEAQCTNSGAWAFNSQSVMLADSPDTNWEEYQGRLDDVRIYNRQLSADEVKALFLAGNPYKNIYGLVAQWKFDEGGTMTTAYDEAGGNNGTLTNFTTPPPWQPEGGQIAGGLSFDGSNDVVTVPDNASGYLDAMSSFTVSMWIRFDAAPSASRLILRKYKSTAPNVSWQIDYSSSSKIQFSVINTAGTWYTALTNTAITPGVWYNIVGIKNGTGISMFLNGVKGGTTATFAGSLVDSPDNLMINDSGAGAVKATYDDIRIYNRALSTEEARAVYMNGLRNVQ